MGEVDSSTIEKSLRNTYDVHKVKHTHSHEEAKFYLEKWMIEYDEVIIITGFREPLSRCISAYFENLTNISNHWYVGDE